jgi:hypothetical protein
MESRGQKLFIKGRKYGTDKTTVMCTKTTCNFSTDYFRGVVVESKEYVKGHFSKSWHMDRFEQLED